MAIADSEVRQLGSREVESPQVLDGAENDEISMSEEAGHSEPVIDTVPEPSVPVEPPLYSVFTTQQKRWNVYIVSFVAMISPLSATVYYPALASLATDFNVSMSLIQLSITTYQVGRQDNLSEIDP